MGNKKTNTGCYICGRKIDKIYLHMTPDDKVYKICGRCFRLVKTLEANVNTKEAKVEKENN